VNLSIILNCAEAWDSLILNKKDFPEESLFQYFSTLLI